MLNQFRDSKYLHSIDLLRGIAALMVVLFHFISLARFGSLPFIFSVGSLGHLGVQVFFIISGFVIPHSMYVAGFTFSKFGGFLLRRLARLEPPYIVSIFVCIILAYISTLSSYYRGEPPSFPLPQVLSHFAYINTFVGYSWINPVYWSLAIEFQFYILIALLYSSLLSKIRFLILLIISFVLSLAVPNFEFIFVHSPFFLCGITLFLYKVGKLTTQFTIASLISILVFITYLHNPTHSITALLTIVAIVTIHKVGKVFMFLGGISYSLYLLHVPVGQRLLNISENFITNPLIMLAVVVVAILLSTLAAWLFKIVIEWPSQLLSKRIKY